MTDRPATPPTFQSQRATSHHIDRMFDETRDDPYQARRKYPEPTRCPSCHSAFVAGRWCRPAEQPATGAAEHRCPACHRIADKQPAGYLTITGPFALLRREEIRALVRREALREGLEHPLHRIMNIEDRDEGLVITTTDVHLPRHLGRALERAYDGRLSVRASPDEYLVHVEWAR